MFDKIMTLKFIVTFLWQCLLQNQEHLDSVEVQRRLK